jgi:hypothetical protein
MLKIKERAAAATTPQPCAEWEDCWESILSLPLRALDSDDLYRNAALFVRDCRLHAADEGLGWLKEEIDDGQIFVREQLEADPADLEWQRIYAALSGALAGLEEPLKLADLETVNATG